MLYTEYKPSDSLKKYVKCYYELEGEGDLAVVDQAFATGCVEVMFTLSGDRWQIRKTDEFHNTPDVALWGQVLQPLTFKSPKKNKIFGIRFYPATAAFLLQADVCQFNDDVFDLEQVLGNSVEELLSKLQEAKSVSARVAFAETFLMTRISVSSKIIAKVNLVSDVMNELAHEDFFDNINTVAARYGITSRYLQKIFMQHTGLTPKQFTKINRFQNSLIMMGNAKMSLTAIAHACGYFDQSHFVREFKSFTGFAPSGFDSENSTAILASPNK